MIVQDSRLCTIGLSEVFIRSPQLEGIRCAEGNESTVTTQVVFQFLLHRTVERHGMMLLRQDDSAHHAFPPQFARPPSPPADDDRLQRRQSGKASIRDAIKPRPTWASSGAPYQRRNSAVFCVIGRMNPVDGIPCAEYHIDAAEITIATRDLQPPGPPTLFNTSNLSPLLPTPPPRPLARDYSPLGRTRPDRRCSFSGPTAGIPMP